MKADTVMAMMMDLNLTLDFRVPFKQQPPNYTLCGAARRVPLELSALLRL